MDENKTNPPEEKKAQEKDYYSAVVVRQFLVCAVFVLLMFFTSFYTGTFGKSVTQRLQEYMYAEADSEMIEDAVSTVKKILTSGDSFAVFNSDMTEKITDGNILGNDG